MPNLLPITGKVPRVFSHFVGSAGNDATVNMVATHAAQLDYYVTPPIGHKWHLHRMIWSMVDAKSFEIEEFASRTALTGGISFVVSRYNEDTLTSTEEVLNHHHPIKDNGDFAHLMFNIQWLKWAASTNEQMSARWNFDEMGAPIVLNYLDKFIVRFLAASNTSAITTVHCAVQGVDLAYAD